MMASYVRHRSKNGPDAGEKGAVVSQGHGPLSGWLTRTVENDRHQLTGVALRHVEHEPQKKVGHGGGVATRSCVLPVSS